MKKHMWQPATGILITVMAASCAAPAAHGRTRPGSAAPSISPTQPSAAIQPSGPQQPSTSSLPAAASPPCRPGQLALGHGPRLSPATEERGDVYLFINRGRMSCTVDGFPRIALYDAAGDRLPFHVSHGQSQYVTSARPTAVVVAPGARAYLLVAQAGCTLGDERRAVRIVITMPRPSRARVAGAAASGQAGVSQLNYCRPAASGATAPLFLSPIEPTFAGTTQPPG